MNRSTQYAAPGELWVLPQAALEDLGVRYVDVLEVVRQA